jgi:hypothetical protein
MVSNESTLIKRHKNPLGIALRILIYPAIAYGLWHHRPLIVAIGLGAEILNWTLMPPVAKTLPFIQNVIDIELKWLRAEKTTTKRVSIGLFFSFPILICFGLWMHSGVLIISAFTMLIAFNVLMQYIANQAD